MHLSSADCIAFHSFGLEIIAQTRKLVLDLWNKNDFSAQTKDDNTPVTEVDLKAEELVRNMISERFPSHGILGEEYPHTNSQSEFQWIVDPIDGTQNLANRIPTFGTLLSLRVENEPILGFIDHPALGVLSHGGKNLGVFQNNKKIRIEDLTSDHLHPGTLVSVGTLGVFQRSHSDKVFFDVLKYQPHSRIYYDCYSHTLTIGGNLAASVEFNLKLWDIAAAEALVREAGGSFVYLDKSPAIDKATRLNTVFGKPRAVRLLLPVIENAMRPEESN